MAVIVWRVRIYGCRYGPHITGGLIVLILLVIVGLNPSSPYGGRVAGQVGCAYLKNISTGDVVEEGMAGEILAQPMYLLYHLWQIIATLC